MEKTKHKTEFLEPVEAVFTKIERAEIVGYVAYSYLGGCFSQIQPQYEHKNQDPFKCPWGMFKTQQDAVDLCRKIYPYGCDLKIFKIIL